MTQAFFAHLLEKDALGKADRERGKFRTFLLTALNNFVANEWSKEQSQKRGGGLKHVSLHFDDGKSQYDNEPKEDITPETLFERRWATTILKQAMTNLELHYNDTGKAEMFKALRPFLGGGQAELPSYQELADQLDVSLSAVKVAIHRLRKKCGELLREEVAATLHQDEDIETELQYLMKLLTH